jgi:hypothetical protein
VKIAETPVPKPFRERFICFGEDILLFVASTGLNPDQVEIYFNPQFLGEQEKGENRVIIFFNKGEKTQAFHFYLPENPSTIYEKNGKKYRITLSIADACCS